MTLALLATTLSRSGSGGGARTVIAVWKVLWCQRLVHLLIPLGKDDIDNTSHLETDASVTSSRSLGSRESSRVSCETTIPRDLKLRRTTAAATWKRGGIRSALIPPEEAQGQSPLSPPALNSTHRCVLLQKLAGRLERNARGIDNRVSVYPPRSVHRQLFFWCSFSSGTPLPPHCALRKLVRESSYSHARTKTLWTRSYSARADSGLTTLFSTHKCQSRCSRSLWFRLRASHRAQASGGSSS